MFRTRVIWCDALLPFRLYSMLIVICMSFSSMDGKNWIPIFKRGSLHRWLSAYRVESLHAREFSLRFRSPVVNVLEKPLAESSAIFSSFTLFCTVYIHPFRPKNYWTLMQYTATQLQLLCWRNRSKRIQRSQEKMILGLLVRTDIKSK